jgi:hypothetical protein
VVNAEDPCGSNLGFLVRDTIMPKINKKTVNCNETRLYLSTENSEDVPVSERSNYCTFEETAKFCLNKQVMHLSS